MKIIFKKIKIDKSIIIFIIYMIMKVKVIKIKIINLILKTLVLIINLKKIINHLILIKNK